MSARVRQHVGDVLAVRVVVIRFPPEHMRQRRAERPVRLKALCREQPEARLRPRV